MIYKELEKIAQGQKERGNSKLYIRNILKEYLQVYILNYIYTSPKYSKELIFTGGTCLRHFYNLGRLSEDLDFDYDNSIDTQELTDDLLEYFKKKYKVSKVYGSVKQSGKQILLKFPLLKELDLVSENESEVLYLKLDLQKNLSARYDTQISSKSLMGFNFVARHYDLATLMSGKVAAILSRKRFVGKEDRESIKGRDYYDLLWYLKKRIQPNMGRVCDILGKQVTKKELKEELNRRVEILVTKYRNDFESDLLPLIENTDFIPVYVQNYEEEYRREIEYL
ncbi:MAG TPA: nucleotidyl transferase AbiEii/AbiGii toxin family protein [Candidatus Dojkabacteria bacterium]|nr:nucleotidyl transferase AbiEii/AbiGii toxin family protein [Candidatus Dojkabacteria bacterium]